MLSSKVKGVDLVDFGVRRLRSGWTVERTDYRVLRSVVLHSQIMNRQQALLFARQAQEEAERES